ncbi:FAD-dependent monooxygenase, partial [Burkholderia sola]|uniref:FAD-dependent monooxygenase n=1 Tax=Burkholderia sola TaxID=2843302 RepID=UPI00338D6AF9
MTEDLLWEWAQECGAQIRRGAEVTALRQHADGVEVDVQDPQQAQGTVTTLNAKYLVGADGGRSVVRTQAGIAFEGRPGTFRGIVIDAQLTAPWPGGRLNADN